MNPLHGFLGNSIPGAIAQHYQGVADNANVCKVGLNTYHQDIPSNDAISFSEDSAHLTHNREIVSMVSSTSKIETQRRTVMKQMSRSYKS